MQRVRLRLHEAPLPPLDRGDHRRGDPACARGPGAGGALRRDRGLRLSAELLESHGHQREGSAQVDALAALQRAPGGRPDPQRAPRRRDAELVPLRGDRTALSRIAAGHPRCARRAAEDRLAAGARGQAQTRGSVDLVPPLRVHETGSARQARASVAGEDLLAPCGGDAGVDGLDGAARVLLGRVDLLERRGVPARRLMQTRGRGYAFSIEIGLKALALYEKGKAPRNEHDLRKLFTFLPAALQERIIRYTEITPGAPFAADPKRFESDLDLVRRVFVEWRYIYETGLADTDLGILQGIAAAIQVVLKEYP